MFYRFRRAWCWVAAALLISIDGRRSTVPHTANPTTPTRRGRKNFKCFKTPTWRHVTSFSFDQLVASCNTSNLHFSPNTVTGLSIQGTTMHCRELLTIILTCTAATACQSLQQQIPLKTTTCASYEAPLEHCDEHPEDNIPESYFVGLAPGRTLIQHSEAIGFAIEPFITDIFPLPGPSIAYGVYNIDDEMLAAIRADKGVWYTYCNYRVKLE